MNHTQESILKVIIYLSRENGRFYCWPAQKTILEFLDRHEQVKICRRTLNYHLRYLEDHGWIPRQRRITKDINGQYHFKSTLYFLTRKCLLWFQKLGKWFRSIKWEFKDFAPLIKEKARTFVQASNFESPPPSPFNDEAFLRNKREIERRAGLRDRDGELTFAGILKNVYGATG